MSPAPPPLNLNRLAYFAKVVESGSFTRAAEQLGLGKAVVSQHVARLEREVGATLLLRTTRKVVPTEAGRALHARCEVILRESAAAFEELSASAAEPRGTLRIAAPLDYGMSVVAPVAATFARAYPSCQVELSLSDKLVDLHSVDVAIRVGWLKDSSHVARRLAPMEQHLVCSPSVAGLAGRLRQPDEVASLPFVANRALSEPDVWRFTHPSQGRRTVRMKVQISVDATLAAHAAVLAGAGLSVLPDYLVATDIASRRLVHVLPEWSLPSGGVHVLFPSARFRPVKVGRFVELLYDAAGASPKSRRAKS